MFNLRTLLSVEMAKQSFPLEGPLQMSFYTEVIPYYNKLLRRHSNNWMLGNSGMGFCECTLNNFIKINFIQQIKENVLYNWVLSTGLIANKGVYKMKDINSSNPLGLHKLNTNENFIILTRFQDTLREKDAAEDSGDEEYDESTSTIPKNEPLEDMATQVAQQPAAGVDRVFSQHEEEYIIEEYDD